VNHLHSSATRKVSAKAKCVIFLIKNYAFLLFTALVYTCETKFDRLSVYFAVYLQVIVEIKQSVRINSGIFKNCLGRFKSLKSKLLTLKFGLNEMRKL
jgi:hypothetical protein